MQNRFLKFAAPLAFALYAVMALCSPAGAQMVTVTAANIVDSTGAPMASGTISFQPSKCPASYTKGICDTSYRIGGKGQALSSPVSATITNGVFSIALPDTNNTNPQNVCFAATITDGVSGNKVSTQAYACVQPGSQTANASWCAGSPLVCNFDNFVPNIAGLALTTIQGGSNNSNSTWTGGTISGAATFESTLTWAMALRRNGTDLNTLTTCGYYDGSGLSDGPAAFGSAYMEVQVVCSADPSATYLWQFAYDMTNSSGTYYARFRDAVGWHAWVQQNTGGSAFTGGTVANPTTFQGTVTLAADPTQALQAATKQYVDNHAGGGSAPARVVYTSQISGATGGYAVTPGSSASGDTDSAAAINTAISGGNVDLEVNSGYALSTSLVLSSNTRVHCTSPQYGFIMRAGANAPAIVNAHQNAPTTANGTGGYVVSNQTDQNITVDGCTLNYNATEAVTGSGLGGTAHTTNASGIIVTGTQFIGVDGLRFTDNRTYDPGTYSLLLANVSNFHVDRNKLSLPLPIVQSKSTDGIHLVGPDTIGWENDNNITAGDDSLPFNADDCNEASQANCMIPGVKWGDITHVYANNNFLNGSSEGIRFLSGSSLIDDVVVTKTHGLICGEVLNAVQYAGLGVGNIGDVTVDGLDLPTTGNAACAFGGTPYNITTSLNMRSFTLRNVDVSNPGEGNPEFLQTGGTIGTLDFDHWKVNTTSSTFSSCILGFNGGTVSHPIITGLVWNDTMGTGSVACGTAVPASLTASTYAGPNRFLASGFAPGILNGDAFTNTYTAGGGGGGGTVTYLDTAFNGEASAGANLAGTTPATCANGCVGPWVLSSGTSDDTYQAGGGVQDATARTSSDTINVGVSNYTLRFTVGVAGAEADIVLRYTDDSNYLVLGVATAGSNCAAMYNVVGGSATQVGVSACGTLVGSYTVVLNGTSVTLTTPVGTTSGATTNTGSKLGLGPTANGSGGATKFTAFSVKSN